MKADVSSQSNSTDLAKRVMEICGEDVFSCYQCGMCSAGCPIVFAMDLLPNQIVRLVQLGLEEDIAKSKTIWLCASCITCSANCPRGLDLCKVMEALRLISLRENIDYMRPSDIPLDALAGFPQIALVSSFRKHTA
ncbi:4Fe-4S dicluster domain-containing protein [Chloroflexota bacterium]